MKRRHGFPEFSRGDEDAGCLFWTLVFIFTALAAGSIAAWFFIDTEP